MKKDIVIIALIAVLFVLMVSSMLASFTFYKEYKEKVDYLEQQNVSGKAKIEGVESKVEAFKMTIDDMLNQVKTYSENIKNIQNSITLSDEERKALLSKLEEMKKAVVEWQKDYSTTVMDIKQGMLNLKDNIDRIRPKSKDFELGRITVKQEDRNVETDTAQKKTAGPTYKSGAVRKAGT
jgi:flagellar basal body-associated protein FliL